jgi:hypothetical protein
MNRAEMDILIFSVCGCNTANDAFETYRESKGKALPVQAWIGPEGSRTLRRPEFLYSRHMKVVVRLSALRTGRL